MRSAEQDDNTREPDSDFLEAYINAEVIQDLEERQDLDQVGRQALRRRLREHASETPKLAGGDVDAAWDLADDDGDETIGGDAPTPGQDVVDEIGKGAGLTYQDDEPLNYAKVFDRDRHRWELNPASAADGDGADLDDGVEDELDELAQLDGDLEEDDIQLVDVDDLAEELDEEQDAEDLAGELEELDELEDDEDLADDDEDDDDGEQ